VVCVNADQATKDRRDRDAVVVSLRDALGHGDKSLVGNKGYRKYLRAGGQQFAVDEDKIKEEARYDGKWLLTTNTDLPAREVALKYKQLWMVEDVFRSMISLLDTRAIYQKREQFAVTRLERLGVKTVIDLRQQGEHSVKAEQRVVEAASMDYFSVPMKGFVAPTDESISKVLAVLQSSDAGPVFVHCRQGVDWTGAVIACYRIAHDGWRNQAALDEAKSYGMHRVEVGLKRYVLRFSSLLRTGSAESSSLTACRRFVI
jgi:protein tyrosine phosphatase (PTP) superfamily phosphohydrolase (DUF442 family)